MYHYKESGLDNIFLLDGYRVHRTSEGTGIAIDDVEGLHKVIGKWLVKLPKPLNGAELRFLRLEMELSQVRLAAILGSNEQNVRRWELARRRPITGSVDRLMRALYGEYIGGDSNVRHIVDRLAELDRVRHPKAQLRETRSGWKVEQVAA